MPNHAGWTPLMISVANGHIDTSKLLIDSGSNVNHNNKIGVTALGFACSYNYIEIASLLLAGGADPNVSDLNDSKTPLISAIENGSLDLVELLLRYNASAHKKNVNGKSSIDIAQELNKKEVIDYYIEKGIIPKI